MKLLIMLLCVTTYLMAHPFHFSLAEAEWNPETKSLEVALQVLAHDLEEALAKHTGKKISAEKTKDIDKIIVSYLKEKFVIKNSQKPLALKWVGKESKVHEIWLYFEFPGDSLEGYYCSNTIFFEIAPFQVNMINLIIEKQKKTLWFTKEKAVYSLLESKIEKHK